MPLYEYSCRDCESQFELLVRGSEQPHCPECESDRLERLLSAPAAPMTGTRNLPMSQPGGGCGLPQCGQGGCMND